MTRTALVLFVAVACNPPIPEETAKTVEAAKQV